MRIGSLFSGIGGLELGLERAGVGRTVFQVEKDPYCRAVLAKHWPEAERYEDVREFKPARGSADLLCGGFPCQDISSANVRGRRGLDGEKSGLWSEYRRVVSESSPTWLVVENSAEWRRWMPQVRADLARVGYASVPLVLSAGFMGAPHARPRGFVVAHSDSHGESVRAFDAETSRLLGVSAAVRDWGAAPPGGFRLDDGVPRRTRELIAYGNAVVPQVAEVIGRAIKAVMA